MKSFKSLLGIFVIVSAFTAGPIFGMDFGLSAIHGCDEENVECVDDLESEKEGILQQYFGAGSFARGLAEYGAFAPASVANPIHDLFCGVWGGALAFEFLRQGRTACPIVTGLALGAFGVMSLWLLEEDCLYVLSDRHLYLIRNMQKARADKCIKDRDIDGYIGNLINLVRNGYGVVVDPPRWLEMKFFKAFKSSSKFDQEGKLQLRDCIKRVLVERELCVEAPDCYSLECVGAMPTGADSPWIFYHPQDDHQFGCRQLDVLLAILLNGDMRQQFDDEIREMEQEENIDPNVPDNAKRALELRLNHLLYADGKNIKG